ncbi:unnamed protein product [Moneuplotes crassus]|uniref:Uncharacterized protein n=2 Tax=Euplotes crassus TaxID=5936 RepID=A0AAD1UQT7_EUPCR|nr:unnamed protein product [Moneuplotes crassus]CAI2374996.1 unnamed protein product [Moneuplotes crassus]
MERESDYLYKIVLVGDVNVGKTYMLMRYIHGEIPKDVHNTIGVEFATQKIQLKDGGTVKAQIWDTAGQEKYKAIIRAHFRRAAGALVVYDITNESSYNNVQNWVQELKENADDDVVIMLVGTKLDIVLKNRTRRKVAKEEAKLFAEKNKMLFEETSSVQNHRVSDCFENLLQEIYDNKNSKYEQMTDKDPRHKVSLESKIYKRKEDSCLGC